MTSSNATRTAPSEKLISDLLDSLDRLFGLHPGFRPVHAKGVMCKGSFAPTSAAAGLTKAPHASRASVPVVVRFSNFTGIPTIPDNDPNASPRGFAVRFYLAEHVHTDIVGHSENGFPVRNGEDFLEFALALAESGAGAAKPTRFDRFLEKHPETAHFVSQPKYIPLSYATESYFAVTAFKFTNQNGDTRYGRFQIRPENGNEYFSD
ncbi:MAG TPA: catalase, partial [Chroococcales cyanobacterium]